MSQGVWRSYSFLLLNPAQHSVTSPVWGYVTLCPMAGPKALIIPPERTTEAAIAETQGQIYRFTIERIALWFARLTDRSAPLIRSTRRLLHPSLVPIRYLLGSQACYPADWSIAGTGPPPVRDTPLLTALHGFCLRLPPDIPFLVMPLSYWRCPSVR